MPLPGASCDECGHGQLREDKMPPASCPTCGGIYGHKQHPLRCGQCNRAIIAIADECETWLLSQPPEADPIAVP